jgi:hypothetical protein
LETSLDARLRRSRHISADSPRIDSFDRLSSLVFLKSLLLTYCIHLILNIHSTFNHKLWLLFSKTFLFIFKLLTFLFNLVLPPRLVDPMANTTLSSTSQEQHEKIDKLRELAVAEDISLPQVCHLIASRSRLHYAYSDQLVVVGD